MIYMTLVPVYKKCPRCKKKYSWNPDVGHMWCPTCGPESLAGAGDIPKKDKGKHLFGIKK